MRILYLGTPDFATIPLAALAQDTRYTLVGIVTQPDRPTGRSKTPQPPPVKATATRLGLDIPIFQPETLRDPTAVATIAALRPDIGIVAAYGEILRSNVLDIPPLGYINIHPSLLPRYRGPTPVASAILSGDSETGVTIMKLDTHMDSGPLLAHRRVPLVPTARTGTLTQELFHTGTQLLLEILEPYRTGTLIPIQQDEQQATYTKLLHKADGLIDWTTSAIHIERMTRAYDPWPGALTTWQQQPLKIIAARAHPDQRTSLPPGTLLAHKTDIWVQTGKGTLELLNIQPAGRRPLSATQWRNGLRNIDGEQLGTIP